MAGQGPTTRDLAILLKQIRQRTQREHGGLKISTVAASLKVSIQSVYAYLDGTTLPPVDLFDDLLHLLGATSQESVRLWKLRDAVEDSRRTRRESPQPGEHIGPTPVVPRQLPAAIRHLSGRQDEIKILDRLLNELQSGVGTVITSAIVGTAGVGKTTLALWWAHRAVDKFPDGQLYANLRGFGPRTAAMRPEEAIRRFLDALDVEPNRFLSSLDSQVALYRSLMAGKRMLLLLDNARDAEQVRPLLPAAPGCLVLVTSRNQLSSLITTDGARVLKLDLLNPLEARQMLLERLDPNRIANEPKAVDEIILRCGRLPLALAIVAARAHERPDYPLSLLADQLREADNRLDVLADGDPFTSVRTVFSWSYKTLSPLAAQLFRQLGLVPVNDINAHATASLAGLPLAQIRPVLNELARANLLVEHAPSRYSLHDLLREYSQELSDVDDTEDQRYSAIDRVLDHYLHTANTAALLLNPNQERATLDLPREGVTPEMPASQTEALKWFTAEAGVFVSTLEYATEKGLDTYTWQAARVLANHLARQGQWHLLATTQHAALAASRKLNDETMQARAHRTLGVAYGWLDQFEHARAHLLDALYLDQKSGDEARQAETHFKLGFVGERQGQHIDALNHTRQALALYREVDNRVGEAEALNAAGWLHSQLSEYHNALTYGEEALTLFREQNNRWGVAATLDSLGYLYHRLGQNNEAIICYTQAIEIQRELGDPQSEGTTLVHLGDLHQSSGNWDAARNAWRNALVIFESLDYPDAEQVQSKLNAMEAPVID